MNGIASLRRATLTSEFTTVCLLATLLGLFAIAGCGDAPQDGTTIKSDARPQEGIDNMKNFMEKKGPQKK